MCSSGAEKNFIHGNERESMKAGFAVKIVLVGIGIAAVAFVGWVMFNSVTSFLPG